MGGVFEDTTTDSKKMHVNQNKRHTTKYQPSGCHSEARRAARILEVGSHFVEAKVERRSLRLDEVWLLTSYGFPMPPLYSYFSPLDQVSC